MQNATTVFSIKSTNLIQGQFLNTQLFVTYLDHELDLEIHNSLVVDLEVQAGGCPVCFCY